MRFALCASLLLAAGCQTYDFSEVEPIAIAQTPVDDLVAARGGRPNVMLAVDTSGSMRETVPGGATRIEELKSAMDGFLEDHGSVARLGLTLFPGESVASTCAAGKLLHDLPLEAASTQALTEQVKAVRASIAGIQVNGGTPTAATLRQLVDLPSLQSGRRDVVLLLTDGLPNCDTSREVNSCRCTGPTTATGACTDARSCLDDDASVAAVRALAAKQISTAVIGFGAEVNSGLGPEVLQKLAVEGGLRRTCKTSNDCGAGDSCDGNYCGRAFYRAANAAELAAVLEAFNKTITPKPCEVNLQTVPQDLRFVTVSVGGVRVDPSQYTVQGQLLVFKPGSDACRKLEASTEESKVPVSARTVEPL
jgi:Mg-chelatase subunit ChlD